MFMDSSASMMGGAGVRTAAIGTFDRSVVAAGTIMANHIRITRKCIGIGTQEAVAEA